MNKEQLGRKEAKKKYRDFKNKHPKLFAVNRQKLITRLVDNLKEKTPLWGSLKISPLKLT